MPQKTFSVSRSWKLVAGHFRPTSPADFSIVVAIRKVVPNRIVALRIRKFHIEVASIGELSAGVRYDLLIAHKGSNSCATGGWTRAGIDLDKQAGVP